ncbi:MAG: metallophosphoesterase [Armatimonadetes bacterium]|nr:metallophosphoesterase [Armatimonadota bacterium]
MAITRRELLAGSATLGAATLLSRGSEATTVKPFRFVHMTDFHVQPELHAGQGMARALQHAMAKKPEFVMLGGDLIMDGSAANEDRTRTQWDLFRRTLKENCSVPCAYCIGNHDVWGWNKAKSHTSGQEARWGKQWFLDVAEIPRTYYAMERGGWKWIVLDTVQPKGDSYDGGLDAEQFDWFKQEIARTPAHQPVMVVSHIPLFAPCAVIYDFDATASIWKASSNEIVGDFHEVKKLFDDHPNVKLSISGHIHLVDRYDYNGVSYLCNGAVCGAWWLGKNRDFEPGYVVVDLFPDGTFKQEFVTWGWKSE